MALQDLTPQLRTRLSRMERAVGWFVILATALLLFGLGYYVYQRAESKGWFIKKVFYQTCIETGAGLNVGDPVKLMGFDVGEITRIVPNDPYNPYNITVEFRVKEPNYGYIWSDSSAKVVAGDFLGHRYLEITKGRLGLPTVHEGTNRVPDGILIRDYFFKRQKELSQQHTNQYELLAALKADSDAHTNLYYTRLDGKPYWLDPEESPALTERLEKVVSQIQAALPNILDLTNKIAATLDSATQLSSNLNAVAMGVKPVVSNLNLATANLNQPGALGEWLLPTNINQKLDSVMGNADTLVMNANTNLANLNLAIISLAGITSNLNAQVQANSNILSSISSAVQDADSFVQGLKHHWLLRSAFKTKKK